VNKVSRPENQEGMSGRSKVQSLDLAPIDTLVEKVLQAAVSLIGHDMATQRRRK
jgi:hypothetical protein